MSTLRPPSKRGAGLKPGGGSRKGLTGIARGLRQEQFGSLVDGLAQATEAEQHHRKALELLLVEGDPSRARAELIDGVEGYRAAQASFEKAGYSASGISVIRTTSKRLSERATAMEKSFSVTRIVFGVGGLFVTIFLGALGVLTLLQPRLSVPGVQVVWIAVVVGLIGAFGLQAPDILNALKSLPLKQRSQPYYSTSV